MKNSLTLFIALLLLARTGLCAGKPQLLSPVDGAVVYVPHPHFHWQREEDAKFDDAHDLQIARDAAFADRVCDERLEVVSRFVPVKPLIPGSYWWRVRRADGEWSQARAFGIKTPQNSLAIRLGSDAREVARAIAEAQVHFPAIVHFEPGEYRLTATGHDGVATLRGVSDVIVDGHGARLILSGTFLTVLDSQRVTIRDLHVTGDVPGHTLVRVTSVAASQKTLTVKAEPGCDADVPRFFGGQGFLNRVDPEHRGRHLGGFVSTQTASAAPVPDAPGTFVISPLPDSALRAQEAGALCVLTRYGEPFVNSRRTDELTFSGITLVDMPGAFSGGAENNAKSYLSCRVLTRTPQDFQGGHSAVGDGRTGEWIEQCEFQMLADDGPNVRTMRMKIAQADGERAVALEHSWTNTDLRPGDTVAFANPQTFATATARVVSASQRDPVRVEVDAALKTLAEQIGVADWSGVFFYRVNPCCEDFVYRHNRHIGGRGHGVKFNGRRGWIADNHFENITGNAIEIGYNWQDAFEGFGASDVLVARNTIQRCGWAPITSFSKTPLGGRYVIRDNRINEVRDAAISLRNCKDVTITGNTFTSTTPPQHGAWIVTQDAKEIHGAMNQFPSDTLEMKTRAQE
jgi:hypothetical protein